MNRRVRAVADERGADPPEDGAAVLIDTAPGVGMENPTR